jgi:hypothetical protein
VVATVEFTDESRLVCEEAGRPPIKLIGPSLIELAVQYNVGVSSETVYIVRENLSTVLLPPEIEEHRPTRPRRRRKLPSQT